MAESYRVKLETQENRSGDADKAAQGFGRRAARPPHLYDTTAEADAAVEFFNAHGYVVLGNCLDDAEIEHLNEFYDRTQRERPEVWD